MRARGVRKRPDGRKWEVGPWDLIRVLFEDREARDIRRLAEV
jgi:hypothetical protein